MVTIKGLDEFSRKLKELEQALSALDGDLTKIRFDPHDPQSIEVAIQKMETTIDERVGTTGRNDMIEKVVETAKERFRVAILERAAAARAPGGGDSE